MIVEREIISYLEKYGNTRENDLICYGTQNLGLSPEKMKRILDHMAIEDRIYRIVHNKLKPAEVYVTLEEPLPPEPVVDAKTSHGEVERILEEAASLARHATRDNVECTS